MSIVPPLMFFLTIKLTELLAQLALLTDSELWQSAQAKLRDEENKQMQLLVWKQQRDGLTAGEQKQAEKLLERYNRTMLVRAQAAVLLKERGIDISSLNPSLVQ